MHKVLYGASFYDWVATYVDLKVMLFLMSDKQHCF